MLRIRIHRGFEFLVKAHPRRPLFFLLQFATLGFTARRVVRSQTEEFRSLVNEDWTNNNKHR